jgi:hypothetical protein
MNKKKILSVFALGGLALSAPFVAFATTTDYSEDSGKKLPINQLSEEEHIEFLQNKLDIQIEHANTLIDALDDDDDVDTDRLKEIVEEFAELEATLAELDVTEETKEDMREFFFEFRDDARGLSAEFKELIQDAFTDDEKEEFREEFEEDMEELNEEYGLPAIERIGKEPRLTTEQIEIIDSDIAEQLEDGDITMSEAMQEIKEILSEMTDEELEELGIERIKPMNRMK